MDSFLSKTLINKAYVVRTPHHALLNCGVRKAFRGDRRRRLAVYLRKTNRATGLGCRLVPSPSFVLSDLVLKFWIFSLGRWCWRN